MRGTTSRARAHVARGAAAALAALIPLATARSPESGARAPRAIGSDDSLPVDPALATGALANGLRYYIRANGRPAYRAVLRLVVDAGSVQEDADQRGLAHFLEHMAFNGTTHFPRHQLIDYLESAGMRFGADINASTSYGETIYKLEVPTDDGRSLAQGLAMLHDWASGGMRIDSAEVVAERGVVMGEWRSRLADTATQTAQRHQDSVLYGGDSPYLARRPIGDTAIVAHALPGPIRRFYHDWYRPDLMTVVIVGDIDPRAVERELRARFGAIPRAAHPRPRVEPPVPANDTPVVDVFRGRVGPSVTAYWKQARGGTANVTGYRQALVEDLLFRHLARTLLALRERDRRPFAYASVGRAPLYARSVDAYVLRVLAPPDSVMSGLANVLTALERVARYGVPQPVLDREKRALLRRLEGDAAAAAARPSGWYADQYVQHALHGDVPLLSAAQALALARRILPTITPEDAARAARFWRARRDLVVQVTLPASAHVVPPTRARVLALFDSVAHLTLPPDSVAAAVSGPLLAHVPAPGRITAAQTDSAAGVTTWTLSNGARVLLKSTTSNPDEVLIDARSPGGFSLLPDSLFFSSGRLVAQMMTQAAGLGALDDDGVAQELATTGLRRFRVSITNTDESISLAGSPRELETLFQLLHLQFTAPRLDTAMLDAWKHVGTVGRTSLDDQLTAILARGHPRRAPVPAALVQLANRSEALAVYRDRFGNAGDFTFTIVGAVTPAEAEPLAERYLASLPSTGVHEVPRSLHLPPWNRVVEQTRRAFDIPKASTLLVFDGLFPASPADYVAEQWRLDALAWVLRLEYTDLLREQMGGTYGVNVQARTYADPEEHYRVTIGFDAAPERMAGMVDTMFAILDSVRAGAVTPRALARVAAMERRSHEDALDDNEYWVRTLALYDRLQIPFARILAMPPRPTAAEIRAAAARYLPADAYIHFTTMPRDSTSFTARDPEGGAEDRRC
ncbi:MAG: insulinase family protein [Gemmatimonadaceae bacterium]|nr:insulinase family protein [Gemmatimonadaceae bacterium]